MPKIVDRANQRFGRLIALEIHGTHPNRQTLWRCVCDCGNTIIVQTTKLANGNTKSCGCLQRDFARSLPHDQMLTHGHARKDGMSSEYSTWRAMKNRCNNPKNIGYASYGGRGIKVCDRWAGSFENFLADMGSKPTAKHTLDRIDNNGDYCPGNCRWVPSSVQSRNKRTTKMVTVRGQTVTQADARLLFAPNLSRGTYAARLSRGWSIEDALFR